MRDILDPVARLVEIARVLDLDHDHISSIDQKR
jgi:hypothetical protein